MSEHSLRRKVVNALRTLHAISVENPAYPGTPDVNFVEGWIELKQVDEWPARGGAVRVDHFTPQQRCWLRRRAHVGGNCFLILQVAQDYLLFDGRMGANVVGHAAKEELLREAMMVWRGWPGDREFLHYVRMLTE